MSDLTPLITPLITEPFGDSAPDEDPASLGAFAYNLRFPGQYADAETTLNYNYFRDYDAGVGRYVQSDPIGLAGEANTFAYVGSDPAGYVDPFGLQQFPGVKQIYQAGEAQAALIYLKGTAALSSAAMATMLLVAARPPAAMVLARLTLATAVRVPSPLLASLANPNLYTNGTDFLSGVLDPGPPSISTPAGRAIGLLNTLDRFLSCRSK